MSDSPSVEGVSSPTSNPSVAQQEELTTAATTATTAMTTTAATSSALALDDAASTAPSTLSPAPSSSPSTPPPTVSPTTPSPSSSPSTPAPTLHPSDAPSAAPSVTDTIYSESGFATQLYVTEARTLNDIEQTLFQGIMMEHTASIGLNLTEPFIKTECMILQQQLGRKTPRTRYLKHSPTRIRHQRRKMQQQDSSNSTDTITDTITSNLVLQVTYHMNWTTRYGLEDINNYPVYFRQYMNDNNGTTLGTLLERLDIIDWNFIEAVGKTDFANVTGLIYQPTSAPSEAPSMLKKPSVPKGSSKPTDVVILFPSQMPSAMPSVKSPALIRPPTEPANGKRKGILAGVLSVLVVVIIGTILAVYIRMHRKRRDEKEADNAASKGEGNELSDSNAANVAAAAPQDPFSGGASGYDENITDPPNKGRSGIPIDQYDVDAEAGTTTTPETAGLTQSSPPTTQLRKQASSSSAQHKKQASSSSTQLRQQSFSNEVGTSSKSKQQIFQSTMATTGVIYPTIDSMISLGIDTSTGREESGVEGAAEGGAPTSPETPRTTVGTLGTFIGANLMANPSGSSGSDSDSFNESLSTHENIGEGDEFDNYRNQLLETLRLEVESSVDGVEGMLSLAITRIFMEAEHKPLDLDWIGGVDLGSIEASCLCQTFEWERKGQSRVRTGQTFFEEMLNKIIAIVHHGLIRPHDGARIIHDCASITGLPLLKELPNTTVAIHGLIKTNDLANGHNLLVQAFEPFGDIVDASIAPMNRGFGFVRFVQPESVEAVLEKHKKSEIVIQDVAVSIRAL